MHVVVTTVIGLNAEYSDCLPSEVAVTVEHKMHVVCRESAKVVSANEA